MSSSADQQECIRAKPLEMRILLGNGNGEVIFAVVNASYQPAIIPISKRVSGIAGHAGETLVVARVGPRGLRS